METNKHGGRATCQHDAASQRHPEHFSPARCASAGPAALAAALCFPARSALISLFAFTAHLQWQQEPEMLPCVTSWAERLSAAVFMTLFKKNLKNWECDGQRGFFYYNITFGLWNIRQITDKNMCFIYLIEKIKLRRSTQLPWAE